MIYGFLRQLSHAAAEISTIYNQPLIGNESTRITANVTQIDNPYGCLRECQSFSLQVKRPRYRFENDDAGCQQHASSGSCSHSIFSNIYFISLLQLKNLKLEWTTEEEYVRN